MPAAAGFTSQALRAGAPRQGEAFGVRILKGTLENRHLCESLCVCWRRGDRYMCVKTEQLGLVLLGAGIGLLVSFALCGWFLRVLVAIILIVLGLLLLK